MANRSYREIPPITAEELRALVSYDPDTGLFRRLTATNVGRFGGYQVGDIATKPRRDGYLWVNVAGKRYVAQRLAWLYVTGCWPKTGMDHKNLDRTDNRWDNLREAAQWQNMANVNINPRNTSGYKGVSFHKRTQTWRADIRVQKKNISLGHFSNPEDAAKAYWEASVKYRGEFARAA